MEEDLWVEELHHKYDHLFEKHYGKIARGIECGEGWKKNVETLLAKFNRINDHKGDVQIFQIKQKFGEARVYYSCNVSNLKLLRKADKEFVVACETTCELCGKHEEGCIKSRRGWIHCLCDECMGRIKH